MSKIMSVWKIRLSPLIASMFTPRIPGLFAPFRHGDGHKMSTSPLVSCSTTLSPPQSQLRVNGQLFSLLTDELQVMTMVLYIYSSSGLARHFGEHVLSFRLFP